jgi:hypothetical protein
MSNRQCDLQGFIQFDEHPDEADLSDNRWEESPEDLFEK